MTARRRASPLGRLFVAVALALAAAGARGEGLSANLDVSFSSTTLTITDALGRSTNTLSNTVPQRYRLAYDKQLFPYLNLLANGGFEWTPGWGNTEGVDTKQDLQRWNVYAAATLGPPVLNVTPYYLRRQEFVSQALGPVSAAAPVVANQSFGIDAGWNPAGLPALALRVSRSENFDLNRQLQDRRQDDIQGTLSYLEVQDLALRYIIRWSDFTESITGVGSRDLVQGAQVTWSGSFWDRVLTTTVNYALGMRITEITSTGGGTVNVQQFPIGGLSLVETFPSTPQLITLAPNPALIDGDTVASAGIDLGFAPALAGDQNFRDMGLRFADTATPVSALWLWVDRQLPPEVSNAYAFTAWQSDDNVAWTQVPITGPVLFGVFDTRFEIPIARTQARYLKVVTKPLPIAVTVDPRFANVVVTELQAYLVVPASEAPPRTTQTSGNFSGSARVLMWRPWNLAYTLAVNASHLGQFAIQDWSVLNALSLGRPIARDLALSARIDRTDSGQSNRPHESQNRWSAQLSWNPLPTLGLSIAYNGLYSQYVEGIGFSNGFSVVGRVDLFTGVSLSAIGGYTWAVDVLGQQRNGVNASIGATVVPFPALTFSGTWTISSSFVLDPVNGVPMDQTSMLQGSATFTPVPALYFSAGVTRSTGSSQGPLTLTNFGAGFSPFAGGQLQLRFGYNENLDSAAQMRNRIFGPGVRWNIRTGTYLDVAYTWNDSVQPALLSQARTFLANLVVNLN